MREIVAYQLNKTLEHLRELPNLVEREYGEIEDFDAIIYEPAKPHGGVDSSFLERFAPYAGPEPIIFLGFLNRLPHQTDFLNNEFLWTIISKRTLYVLRSVGEFSHKAIPIRIFDYHLKNDLPIYLDRKDLTPEICNEDYIILQLMEYVDAVDLENSKFEELEPDDPIPPRITQLTLNEPKDGFPPIFRLAQREIYSASYSDIYISKVAKNALEDAGIKGISFIPEEGFNAEEMVSK
jgi:hypothetical protein